MISCVLDIKTTPDLNPVLRKKKFLRENPTYEKFKNIQKPREKCPDCHGEIYLKWGPVRINPYWSHFKIQNNCSWKGKKDCFAGGESEEHMDSKTLVVDQLNHSSAKVATKCCYCGKESTKELPVLKYESEARQETDGRVCFWDVAGKNSQGQIEIGIEIKHSHTPENLSARKRVWWVEVEALEVIEKQTETIPVWTNIRKDQICFGNAECMKKAIEGIERNEREKRDNEALIRMMEEDRVEIQRKIAEELETKKKEKERQETERKKLAEELGYVIDGKYTDIVDLSEEWRRDKIKKLVGCIWCGEDKELEHVPYCWDCRKIVIEADKERVKKWGADSGIYSHGSWKRKRPVNNSHQNDWERLEAATKCARCQVRCRAYGGYSKIIPFCRNCYDYTGAEDAESDEKEQTERLQNETLVIENRQEVQVERKEERHASNDVTVPIRKRTYEEEIIERTKKTAELYKKTQEALGSSKPSNTKKQKTTKDAEQPKPAVVDTEYERIEELLSRFDGNQDYGPCLGITRLTRWQRAVEFDLKPPLEVKKELEKDLEKNKPPKHQQARTIIRRHQ